MRSSTIPRLAAVASLLAAFAPPALAATVQTLAGGRTGSVPALQQPIPQPTGVALDGAGNLYVAVYAGAGVARMDASGAVTFVAQNHGGSAFDGDGGPAAAGNVGCPSGVVPDGKGNLFVADQCYQVVKRIDANGIITTVAGNATIGYSGDGGPATQASFSLMTGVAVDAAGNLFITDTENHRVRKVDASGIVTTIAGNGAAGFAGDGGPASSAVLNRPVWPVLDAAGNLYFSDSSNHRVRRIDPSGTIATVAGNGSSVTSGDGGPAVQAGLSTGEVSLDRAGNLYVTDGGRIRKVDAAGIITTFAGNGTLAFAGDGGPATAASLYWPGTLAFDAVGNAYVPDYGNHRIRKIDARGIITTIAGNGSYARTPDGLSALAYGLYPWAIGWDPAGDLAFADLSSMQIRKVDSAGKVRTLAGAGCDNSGCMTFSGDGGPATQAQLANPMGFAYDGAGNLYVADTSNNRVRRVSPSGTITTVAGNGTAGYSGDGGPAAQASLNGPVSIAIDGTGNVLVSDIGNQRVRMIRTDGTIVTVAGNGVAGFSGDGGPATAASLGDPRGLALDGAGGFYVADYSNNRIRRVATDGSISTIAGNGGAAFAGDGGLATAASLNGPFGLVRDAQGNLYVSDFWNNRIRRIDAAGIIRTIAGSGSLRSSDGPALAAGLPYPMGLAADRFGDVYVADAGGSGRLAWINLKPYVDFTLAPTRGFPGLSVAFTNGTRSADGTTWSWSFGDGATSTAASPTHAYPAKGIYSVTLTAQGLDPADTVTKTLRDAVCVGYVFSSAPETATTAPFTRDYARTGRLYARAWATGVDFANVRSATLRVRLTTGGRSVTANLVHEGNGVFSGSTALSTLTAGAASASITITDRANRTFSATESVTIR